MPISSMPESPDSYHLGSTLENRSRQRDSYNDPLPGDIILSPHPRHPVAQTHHRPSSGGSPAPKRFGSFASSVTSLETPLGTRIHSIDNYNPEAMVDSHPMFPSDIKNNFSHRGDNPKAGLQPTDSGFIQVQPATVVGRLKSILSLRSLGPRRRAVANVDLAKALHEENPNPWSPHMLKLYFFLAVACLNSLSNGYDSSLMGGLNNMQYYHKYFKLDQTGSETGLIFSIYMIGNIFGSFFCGPLSDLWGRRWGMFHGAITLIVGACIQGFAYSGPSGDRREMFMIGRFILGFGMATAATAGPVYVAEMSHPAWRGLMTGLYNCSWFIGGITATWIMWRTSVIESDLSWRLPCWLQTVPAGLTLVACIFIPETPRWLFGNDRQEEAIQVLMKYQGGGNRRSPIVILTVREMIERIIIQSADKKWWDYSELFNSKPAIYRLLCVAGMAITGQWAGSGVVTYFMPVLLSHVGIRDSTTQLLYNAILNVLQYIISICGAISSDRIGRRPVLLTATCIFVILWIIITTLISFLPLQEVGKLSGSIADEAIIGSKVAISLICLFALTYSFSITPLQVVYPVECLSYETRAKGMGVNNFVVNITGFYNAYGIPVVVDKIGYRMYWIYAAWNVLQGLFMWKFFVETKGRTLEEINEIFEAENPVKKSLQQHIVEETDLGLLYHGMLNDLHDVEEIPLSNRGPYPRDQGFAIPSPPAPQENPPGPASSH